MVSFYVDIRDQLLRDARNTNKPRVSSWHLSSLEYFIYLGDGQLPRKDSFPLSPLVTDP